MNLGQRLKDARERVGLTQAAVCERASIGESSLSDFERGQREPSVAQLQKLAKVYACSVGELLDGVPARDDVVRWRDRPREKAAEYEAQFLQLCRQYRNLEQWCGVEPATALPSFDAAKPVTTFGDADELAKRVRRELGLGQRPALELLQVLEEDCAVRVFHLAFAPTGTAACTRSTALGAAVLLNRKNPRTRRNFDLAHELFHLVTWEQFVAADAGVAAEREEQLANVFASSLLLPEESVKSAVHRRAPRGELSPVAVLEIAREFDVSPEALLWRLQGLLWPKDKARTKEVIAQAKAPRGDDHAPPQLPDRYRALALTALRQGEISIGRYADYLGITRREAMRHAEGGEDADEATAPPSA